MFSSVSSNIAGRIRYFKKWVVPLLRVDMPEPEDINHGAHKEHKVFLVFFVVFVVKMGWLLASTRMGRLPNSSSLL
jgi:hypothetical protein